MLCPLSYLIHLNEFPFHASWVNSSHGHGARTAGERLRYFGGKAAAAEWKVMTLRLFEAFHTSRVSSSVLNSSLFVLFSITLLCTRSRRGEMARVVEQKIKALRVEKEKFGFEPEAGDVSRAQANSGIDNAWYKEVLELRKKAGEYRVGVDGTIFHTLVRILITLVCFLRTVAGEWRWIPISLLSRLSCGTKCPAAVRWVHFRWHQAYGTVSHSGHCKSKKAHMVHVFHAFLYFPSRPITKEEKDKENNKKSSPTKPRGGRVPGGARPVEANRAALPDGLNFSAAARSRKDAIRHHLERTTGPDVEEGALLPSPTREKLMPAIPRSKADSPQRGSPQKTALSRHGSPQKGSPQKSSPKKMSSKGRLFTTDIELITEKYKNGIGYHQVYALTCLELTIMLRVNRLVTISQTQNELHMLRLETLRFSRQTKWSISFHTRF